MEEKTYPPVMVVDEHDNILGYMDLFAAIALGHIRRVSSVFVVDEANRILIQRRAAHVLSPNLLDFSAAGHVNEGQDYEAAAKVELEEELGLKNVTVEPILPPLYIPGFYNGLFRTVLRGDVSMTLATDEVTNVFWVTLDELKEMIANDPQQFTEPFLAVWPHVCDKIIS
ncbi:MAG: hypothetical protein RLZZ480_604 [Candidatus Parcubacteria bacterium]|jgi:isopentenyldiphosphate isomerase